MEGESDCLYGSKLLARLTHPDSPTDVLCGWLPSLRAAVGFLGLASEAKVPGSKPWLCLCCGVWSLGLNVHPTNPGRRTASS